MTERYCNIECKSLEDIKETCERHISNGFNMMMDSIDAEDFSSTDAFYINMFMQTWYDLLQDVEKLLEKS